jgi:cobalt-zinc-cadmium efflux system membrane fusion protein
MNSVSHRIALPARSALHTLKLCTLSLFAVATLLTMPAVAGPGHDHGDEPAQATGTASPRMSSHSDLFELVAIAEKVGLVIYLDRFASNEPVTQAKIEVESGAIKAIAEPQADGTYLVKTDLVAKPGSIPLSFTVIDGKDTDLLAGDLVIPDAHADHAHDQHDGWLANPWFKWLGAALLGILVVVAGRQLIKSRQSKAMLSLSALATAIFVAWPAETVAGPGHDHGDAAPVASSNAPKRQSDGSVFLPKPSQRLLAVRTTIVEQAELPRTVELAGRVIADPNSGGKVQPTQAGRIEAAGAGLPALGQSVRKGQSLAIVRSSVSAIDRANQIAASLETQNGIELAKKRLARLEQLEGSVPQKEIEAARFELQNLLQRSKAIGGSALATENLLAPVSGVIAAVNVVAGQVVDAREVLFEIVDPARLMVEASAFDPALINNVAGASVIVGESSAKLRYVGAGRVLREGAIPMIFRSEGAQALPLAVGQSLKLTVQTKEMVKGFPVPVAAVVKNPSNQDIVWVHTGAEQFAPRVVRFAALDAVRVAVLEGLVKGDRVVTQGAALVNQVR